jgi:predicted Zn-dependent protease
MKTLLLKRFATLARATIGARPLTRARDLPTLHFFAPVFGGLWREDAMSQTRIDVFTAMAAEQPDNEMIWYGLANEYTKLAAWPQAAEALRNVLRLNPDYTSAYQMLGTALANAGDPDEARRVWTAGVAVADRTGAWKARQHMEGLLAGMPPEAETGFCTE